MGQKKNTGENKMKCDQFTDLRIKNTPNIFCFDKTKIIMQFSSETAYNHFTNNLIEEKIIKLQKLNK